MTNELVKLNIDGDVSIITLDASFEDCRADSGSGFSIMINP